MVPNQLHVKKSYWVVLIVMILVVGLVSLCVVINGLSRRSDDSDASEDDIAEEQEDVHLVDRESKIPDGAVKMSPDLDLYPPILHSSEFEQPVPVNGGINTSGAEDSPFIVPEGDVMYFFFTPEVSVAPELQLFDEVTGIYVSTRDNSGWGGITRVILQDSGKLALDGCEFVQGDVMLFCSSRQGYSGINWFTARRIEDSWSDWEKVDFNINVEVGELHVTSDGQQLYFHSSDVGGWGGLDIWVSEKNDDGWGEAVNMEVVNTSEDEGWPFVTSDLTELWFTRTYNGSPAIFRSKLENGIWQFPELIVSQFAGEPTLDDSGNLYFVHHFFDNGVMIEADIYVAVAK